MRLLGIKDQDDGFKAIISTITLNVSSLNTPIKKQRLTDLIKKKN